ncbi:hypothetical protein P692DRAFT_20256981 [Suillus brevipes Sb2]|nr:hypothetical protein P692DRAFT_20256981 [Suillus brevipes Sb2]
MIEDLTHPAISGVPIRPKLHEFINIHQGLSSLQTLILELIGTLPMPIINVPQGVSSIKLRGFAQDCSVLLQHIRAPCIKAFAFIDLKRGFKRGFNLPDFLAAVSASRAKCKGATIKTTPILHQLSADQSASILVPFAATAVTNHTAGHDGVLPGHRYIL